MDQAIWISKPHRNEILHLEKLEELFAEFQKVLDWEEFYKIKREELDAPILDIIDLTYSQKDAIENKIFEDYAKLFDEWAVSILKTGNTAVSLHYSINITKN